MNRKGPRRNAKRTTGEGAVKYRYCLESRVPWTPTLVNRPQVKGAQISKFLECEHGSLGVGAHWLHIQLWAANIKGHGGCMSNQPQLKEWQIAKQLWLKRGQVNKCRANHGRGCGKYQSPWLNGGYTSSQPRCRAGKYQGTQWVHDEPPTLKGRQTSDLG